MHKTVKNVLAILAETVCGVQYITLNSEHQIILCPNLRLLLSRSETGTLPLSRSETNMKNGLIWNFEFYLEFFASSSSSFTFVTSSIANLSTEIKKIMFCLSCAVVRPQILSKVLIFVGLKSYTVQIRLVHCTLMAGTCAGRNIVQGIIMVHVKPIGYRVSITRTGVALCTHEQALFKANMNTFNTL